MQGEEGAERLLALFETATFTLTRLQFVVGSPGSSPARATLQGVGHRLAVWTLRAHMRMSS